MDTVKDFWDNNVVETDKILKDIKVGNTTHRIIQHIGGDVIVHEKNKQVGASISQKYLSLLVIQLIL
ncbi:hypothetical protein IA615_08445 [Listeria seeligeri]|nr:hypothetical protein [Listeria seeligeri]